MWMRVMRAFVLLVFLFIIFFFFSFFSSSYFICYFFKELSNISLLAVCRKKMQPSTAFQYDTNWFLLILCIFVFLKGMDGICTVFCVKFLTKVAVISHAFSTTACCCFFPDISNGIFFSDTVCVWVLTQCFSMAIIVFYMPKLSVSDLFEVW